MSTSLCLFRRLWIRRVSPLNILSPLCNTHRIPIRRFCTASPPSIDLQMPELPNVKYGNVGQWDVSVGDHVSEDQALVDIETKHAVFSFEAPESGYIAKIVVPSGSQKVKVGQTLALMVTKEEDILAAQKVDDVPEFNHKNSSVRGFLTPAATHWAHAHNIDLKSLTGSGRGGRVTKEDVRTQLEAKTVRFVESVELPRPAPATPRAAPSKSISSEVQRSSPTTQFPRRSARSHTDRAHSQMRRVIAARLADSKRTVPHAYAAEECRVDALMELRRKMKEKSGKAPSVNDFVVRAVALSLRKVPEANQVWNESLGCSQQCDSVDISIAVSTDGGLITPIVKGADLLNLNDVNRTVKDLAMRARDNKLQPEEFMGGTFTISNLGMFGVRSFTAVINPPQACILAVSSAVTRMSVREGSAQPEKCAWMNVQLSADRRAVDETVGGRFLTTFREFVENPATLL
eukprot:528307_1